MNNKKNIYLFLILLPIIDLITSLTTRFGLLSISVGMIIKTVFIAFMLYYVFFKSFSKHKKKSIAYLIFIFIYIILYFLTKLKYITTSAIIVEEVKYMFKVMYYPILFPCLLCYFDDKKFSKRELNYVLFFTVIIYSILLFVPLILGCSFKTYDSSLQGNIGWFFSANEISIILVLTFPFLNQILKNKKMYCVLIPLLVILIISTIGTKSSMVGLLIDTFLVFVLSLFYKNRQKSSKKLIISTFIIFIITSIVFLNSNSLNNFKVTLGIQTEQNQEQIKKDKEINDKRLQERKLINEEIKRLEKNKVKKEETLFVKFYNQYGKALLSDREIYFRVTNNIYQKNYNINTVLFGLGYTNNDAIQTFAITKLIEIDPLDIFFHSGLIALIIVFMPILYYLYLIIRNRRITVNSVFYTLMLGLIFCVSFISGHTFMAPAVSIYIALYLIYAYAEQNAINLKDDKIKKNKVSIYALHLNYGGVEKNICMKANILSELYDVEIISLYKLNETPSFDLNDKVKVKYLTENVRPNKKEFIEAVKAKNPFKILKEGIKAARVLYLKRVLLTKSMTNCNSEIIISTRIDFTEKLLKNNEYKNIKIAEEHIYHNNNSKYLNRLYSILKSIDYLMPSSKYLCSYYKDLFNDYSYKLLTNNMPIETNNKLSNLKNKTIISVGRLSKEKGYEDLIRLFAKLNNKDWELLIVGDGPDYNYLNNLIKEKKMEDNIKLLGFKSPKELNELYKSSSIYVMTSLEESFGLVLIEAASHGLPIVAYDSALGAKEILSNDNGILIPNRDEKKMITTLKDLMDNIDLRKEYQKKSKNIAESYSYDKVCQDNIDFFKDIKRNSMYKNLYQDSKKDCYKLLENKLKNNEKQFIITANPETYMLSKINKTINDMLYDKDNLIVPDGISIVKTANYLNYSVTERISGIDIAEYLLKLADKKKYKVYLFGATREVMDKLTEVINKKFPNIELVGTTDGYVKNKEAVMEYIGEIKPDIVMLALGIPLQEKLIYNHIKDYEKGIFIGVGGSFDVLSGTKKRAPKLFIKLNLEWLYRICKEPKRLMRFIKHNIRFLIVILKEKIYTKMDKQ